MGSRIDEEWSQWGPARTDDLRHQLASALEERGEWNDEIQAELESLGADADSFMEACLNLLEGAR